MIASTLYRPRKKISTGGDGGRGDGCEWFVAAVAQYPSACTWPSSESYQICCCCCCSSPLTDAVAAGAGAGNAGAVGGAGAAAAAAVHGVRVRVRVRDSSPRSARTQLLLLVLARAHSLGQHRCSQRHRRKTGSVHSLFAGVDRHRRRCRRGLYSRCARPASVLRRRRGRHSARTWTSRA